MQIQVNTVYKNSSFTKGCNRVAIKVPSTSRTVITFEHVLLMTINKRSYMHVLIITTMLASNHIVLCIAMCVFHLHILYVYMHLILSLTYVW